VHESVAALLSFRRHTQLGDGLAKFEISTVVEGNTAELDGSENTGFSKRATAMVTTETELEVPSPAHPTAATCVSSTASGIAQAGEAEYAKAPERVVPVVGLPHTGVATGERP
jgi:hypothetical protein